MPRFDGPGARRPASALACAALVVASLAGCARPASGPAGGPTGTVTGTVRTFGGPAIGGTPAANGQPRAGAVLRFSQDGHQAGAATTDSAGRFTVRLPAGSYGVDPCGSGVPTDEITVEAGKSLVHDLRCEVP